MRIYTRQGDDGTTGLFGGGPRVKKHDARVEAYGTVDELNAILGWARAARLPDAVDSVLERAQSACLRLGAQLATSMGADPGVPPPGDDDVLEMETAIDALEATLPPLKTFLLPGGSEAAARLHVARTVCRRAERTLTALSDRTGPLPGAALRWLNRLSDLLFMQARQANAAAGVPDVPWVPRARP